MTVEEQGTHSKTVREGKDGLKVVVLGNLTLGKLVLMTLISLVLCAVSPLSILAPLPLALAFLLFGVKKTFIVSGFTAGFAFLVSLAISGLVNFSAFGFIFAFMTIVGFAISTIVTRQEHPVKGLLIRVGFVAGLLIAGVLYLDNYSDMSLRGQVEQIVVMQAEQTKNHADYKATQEAGGEVARMVNIFVNDPQTVARDAYQYVYSMIFMGSFLLIWLPLNMLLRFKKIWSQFHDYKFSEKELRSFKTPEPLIFVFVLGLALFIGGDLMGPSFTAVGVNLIGMMGIVYFFQGIGLYLDFLRHTNVVGFMRLILVMLTVIYAYNVLAIFGVIDNWVNFRKYFKKEEK